MRTESGQRRCDYSDHSDYSDERRLLTFVTLVAEVAILLLERPAERVARVGVVGRGGVEDTVHIRLGLGEDARGWR